MLSKTYEFTEVDRRTWLHMPFGTYGPPTLKLSFKPAWQFVQVIVIVVALRKQKVTDCIMRI